MPRIFDNTEETLLAALRKTLPPADRSDSCVGAVVGMGKEPRIIGERTGRTSGYIPDDLKTSKDHPMKSDRPTIEGRRAEQVLRGAVRKVIEENRKLGLPVAVMKEGKAVLISAEKAVAAVQEPRATYSTRKKRPAARSEQS